MKATDSGVKGLRGFGLVRPGKGLKSEKTLGGLSASAVESGLAPADLPPPIRATASRGSGFPLTRGDLPQRRGEGLVVGLGLRLGLGGKGSIFLQLPLLGFHPAIYRRIRRLMGGVFREFYPEVGIEKVEKIVDLQYLIKVHKFPERLLVVHGQIVV